MLSSRLKALGSVLALLASVVVPVASFDNGRSDNVRIYLLLLRLKSY